MILLAWLLLWVANNPWFVNLILAHKVTWSVILYSLFAAAVDGMPAPDANSSKTYRWLYGALHTLALNVFTALRAFFPQIGFLLFRPAPAPEDPTPNPSQARVLQMSARDDQNPSKAA